MELLILVAVFVLFIVLTSSISKKKQNEQRKTMDESLVPGAWVQTIGGFCGKVVEIDGDVVVLATPSGEESLWLRRAIARVEEPPFAIVDDENESDIENDENSELENQVHEEILEEKVDSTDDIKAEEETNNSEEEIKEEK
ncbi:preprotein translocase subunit YajC [Actinomyces sp. zg-332]|uniref:preprotein translocase subunit YajC n=1 Tax=Actinomyces sp. zg-332 TaxID=2708340 RepID=UPI001421D1E9|nr:preprotein translocase subunit YajC [Actinomyces sp. zg-332]QPK93664.1 preprotein translocase subunit YajC [Actinomyces sp. zg-332]